MKHGWRRLLAAGMSVALLLGGCGGGPDAGANSPVPTVSPLPAASPACGQFPTQVLNASSVAVAMRLNGIDVAEIDPGQSFHFTQMSLAGASAQIPWAMRFTEKGSGRLVSDLVVDPMTTPSPLLVRIEATGDRVEVAGGGDGRCS